MEKIELTSFVRTTVLIIYISIWCTTQNMVLSMLKRKVFVNLVFVAVDWFSRLSITSSNATTKAIKKPPKIQITTFCAGRQWASIYYTTDLKMTTEGDWKLQAFHSLKHSEDETQALSVAYRLKGSLIVETTEQREEPVHSMLGPQTRRS